MDNNVVDNKMTDTEVIDKTYEINNLLSFIQENPFAFIFGTLGFGIGILIDNKRKNNLGGMKNVKR